MGLDIIYYRNLKRACNGECGLDTDKFWCMNDDHVQFFLNAPWKGTLRTSPIELVHKRNDGLSRSVCYTNLPYDRVSVRVGGYGFYNAWRETLSYMVLGVSPKTVWENEDDFIGKPFFELVDFSDCEGAFGSTVCEKLYGDFLEHKSRWFDAHPSISDYGEIYEQFMKAFKYASDNGAVKFC